MERARDNFINFQKKLKKMHSMCRLRYKHRSILAVANFESVRQSSVRIDVGVPESIQCLITFFKHRQHRHVRLNTRSCYSNFQ